MKPRTLHDLARPIARRKAREEAEALLHLPIGVAQKQAKRAGRKAGREAVDEVIPSSERSWSGDGNDGFTYRALFEVGIDEALRTLYAAAQPSVDEAPIDTEETAIGPILGFPEGVENREEYHERRGTSKRVFSIPVWTRGGISMLQMTPWIEGRPAVKRLGPNAKREGKGEHVQPGKPAYQIGFMERSNRGTLQFKNLLLGSDTLGEARAFVSEHGEEAVAGGESMIRGWERLLEELSET